MRGSTGVWVAILISTGCICPDGSLPDPGVGCPVPGDGGDADAGGDVGEDAGEGADDGGGTIECDLYAQDCGEGQKCAPYALDDAPWWNSTYCVDILPSPVEIGGTCQVDGVLTGIDDCTLGAVCLDVDVELSQGVCIGLPPSQRGPCESEGTAIANENGIGLCLPVCNPLLQNCAPGQACYPVGESWTCAPDASGESGAYGDACEFINVCDPGRICLGAAAVPGCVGSGGCCSDICDITDPGGDAQCSGQAGGQTCQAWYEEGMAPAGFEDVGACALPA